VCTRAEEQVSVHNVDVALDDTGQADLRFENQQVSRDSPLARDDRITSPDLKPTSLEKARESTVESVSSPRLKRDVLGPDGRRHRDQQQREADRNPDSSSIPNPGPSSSDHRASTEPSQ